MNELMDDFRTIIITLQACIAVCLVALALVIVFH